MNTQEDIAIVGWAGKFPEADSIVQFFENLKGEKDSVRKLSPDRIMKSSIDRDANYQLIGFMDDIDHFDFDFFGISQAEADFMAPQHRKILEVAYQAFENGALTKKDFSGQKASVFFGAPPMTYHYHAESFHPSLFTGNLVSTMAGRVARFFDLRGGATMIDTACSSSLVALHYAIRDLQCSDADIAIVGGAEIECFPQAEEGYMGSMNIFSPEGKTKTFSAEAKGTASGEAVVCMVLKTHTKALADGDLIHGIIKGSAINQDAARSASLSAPDSVAQAEVLSAAWDKAGINPEELSYIECHGTGTPIGDPIEIKGIDLAFSKYTAKKQFCAVSSAKSNIGHCNAAAGLVGLTKAVLSLKSGYLFPSLHFAEPNNLINFEQSAVFVNDKLRAWDDVASGPRLAGVSSFGISGTNCHVVIEAAAEQQPQTEETSVRKVHLVSVTAPNEKTLARTKLHLANALEQAKEDDLGTVAYTLNRGRQQFDVGDCFAVKSVQELIDSLRSDKINKRPEKAQPLWFFFTGKTQNATQILTSFYDEYQLVKNTCDEVDALQLNVDKTILDSFKLQLATYHLLTSWSYAPLKIAGIGNGKAITSYLTDKRSLEEALRAYALPEEEEIAVLESRFQKFIQAQANSTPIAMSLLGGEDKAWLALTKCAGLNPDVVRATFSMEMANHLLPFVQLSFQAGHAVNWEQFYENSNSRKIELPGIQFEPTRCWIKSVDEYFDQYIPDWLYDFSWEAYADNKEQQQTLADEYFLLVGGQDHAVTRSLAEKLTERNQVIRVGYGDVFAGSLEGGFTIRKGEKDDLKELYLALKPELSQLTGFILLDGITTAESSEDASSTDNELARTLIAQQQFLKTFHSVLKSSAMKVIQLTADAFIINEGDEFIPARYPLHMLVKSLMTEYPLLEARSIDFSATESSDQIANTVINELAGSDFYVIKARRNGESYIQKLGAIEKTNVDGSFTKKWMDDAFYLVIGGSGGIGAAVSQELTTATNVNVIFVGRTELPKREDWANISSDHSNYHRVANMMEVEMRGGKAHYFQADIGDKVSVQNLVKELKSITNKLEGVFHLAGISGSFKQNYKIEKEDLENTLKPKLQGFQNLMELMPELSPEFLVVFSSLITVIPAAKSLDYIVANAYLDALGQVEQQRIPTVKVLNWGAWDDTGMMKGAAQGEDSVIRSYWPKEAIHAMKLALNTNAKRIAVAHLDTDNITMNPFFRLAPKHHGQVSVEDQNFSFDLSSFPDSWSHVEKEIGSVWLKLLRKQNLELTDNFFELGGHSLIGTQLMNHIQKKYKVRLNIKDLYTYPTIAELAQAVGGDFEDNEGGIPIAPEQESYPISFSQRRLWFLCKTIGSSLPYTIPQVFEFNGTVNVKLLEKSFRTLVRRHESLRTVFRPDERGEVWQHILDDSDIDFKLSEIDLRDDENSTESLESIIDQEFSVELDLENGPLLRSLMIRVADDHYYFVNVMHHIISDGWSIEVMMSELLQLYGALKAGQQSPLAPLRIQYKDFSQWVHHRIESGEFELARKFWTFKFEKSVPKLELPFSKQRPAFKTYNGQSVDYQIDGSLLVGLRNLIKEESGSLYMGLVTALTSLMHLVSQQGDIVIGSPVAGRDHIDVENLIGFFINTVAIRTTFEKQQTIRGLFKHVKNDVLESYEHQLYPLDQLINDLSLETDRSRSPLFDCMIALQNLDVSHTESQNDALGFSLKPHLRNRDVSQFDLSFVFVERQGGLALNIEFNTDLFEREDMDIFVEHFEVFLASLSSGLDTPLSSLNYIGTAQESRLLNEFSGRTTSYPKEESIQRLFEQQVETTPNAIALAFKDDVWTYAELNAQANQLANYLVEKHDVAKGALVALELGANASFIIGILASLKAGAGYVPMEPEFPQSRRNFICADSQIQVNLDIELFSKFQADSANYAAENLNIENGPKDVSYIMYTSGSTGKPKGVVVPHRGVVRLVKNSDYIDFGPNLKILATASVSFDVSTFEYWSALLNGGQLVMLEKNDLLNISELKMQLATHEINTLWLTAGFMNQLVETDLTVFAGLTTLIAGGDRLSPSHLAEIFKHYPNLKIVNGYGPTENTTFSLCGEVLEEELPLVTLGKPVCNSTAYLLDNDLNLVGQGCQGEICVGGDGLAVGYLNSDQLNEEKFVAHPFVQGERLYRTGDLGRWLPDGRMEFLGRKDFQVKIRGFRVEPGEIEDALQNLDVVKQAAITVIKRKEKELVAYCVFNNSEEKNIEKVKLELTKFLPAHMIPSFFVLMDEIPLNASGKVDRKALPEPQVGASLVAQKPIVPPSTKTEMQLLAIWKKLLNRNDISVDDQFFEVGGHSLRLMSLHAEIIKEFGVSLRIQTLFHSAILSEQATLIDAEGSSDYTEISVIPRAEEYTLSPSQRRMFVLSSFEGGNAAYNIYGCFKLIGDVDAIILEKSLQACVARHDALRTIFFRDKQGTPKQKVLAYDETQKALYVENLIEEDWSTSQIDDAIQLRIESEFDLSNGPLFNTTLIQRTPSENVFVFVIHHIVGDGWSIDLLMQEVLAHYSAELSGKAVELEPLAIQYKDYSAWINDRLSGDELEGLRSYWTDRFSGDIPVLDLPSQHQRPAVIGFEGNIKTFRLTDAVYENLKQLTKEQQGTLFMTLITALNSLFNRYTGEEDIVLGVPVAGREHADLQRQVGMYVNTLPLKTSFSAADSVSTLYSKVKEGMLSAFDHQLYPFEQIVEDLDVQRDMSRSTLFDVMVVLLNQDMSGYNVEQEVPFELESHEFSHNVSHFDLTFTFSESVEKLVLTAEYSTALFEEEDIDRMVSHFQQLVEEMGRDATQRISDLNYMSQQEQVMLTESFNPPLTDYPRDVTILDLCQSKANEQPNAVALVCGGRKFTYAELQSKVNQFGNYLVKEEGVTSGDVIAIQQNRSEWLIVSILGTMSVGAIYVPIDPALPQDRIDYMLAEVTPKLVITNELMEVVESKLATYSSHRSQQVAASNDLAYIIFTSGSTGNPKGVKVAHRSLVNITNGWITEYKLHDFRINTLQLASASFDVFVGDYCRTLLSGGTLILAEDDERLDFNRLYEMIHEYEINFIESTPALLVPFFRFAFADGRAISSLKVLITGSDSISVTDLQAIVDDLSPYGTRILNSYGITEATIDSSYFEVAENALGNTGKAPIGKPFANNIFYVLDKQLNLLPLLAVGELFIGGENLAEGYWKNTELTNEKYIENPFSPKKRLYRTGDLARWTKEGKIDLIGRRDTQVKLRGYRLEPGEVENAITDHENVAEAIVVPKISDGKITDLICYVVFKAAPDTKALHKHLLGRLPAYMIPGFWKVMTELPKTHNGKYNRKSLPEVSEDDRLSSAAFVAPRNVSEQQLLELFCKVLGADHLGIQHNFFEAGGQSILAIELLSQINVHFNVQISLRAIFTSPTVEELVLEITADKQHKLPAISVNPEMEDYPLTPGQNMMWVFQQMNPKAAAAYHMSSAMYMDHELDEPAFEKAVKALTQRHASLRTVFVQKRGRVRQVVLDNVQAPLNSVDLTLNTNQDALVQAEIARIDSEAMDLENGPLFRISLMKLESNRYVLAVCFHHIICDGWSEEIVVRDLLELYAAEAETREHRLPALKVQYCDFALWIDELKNDLNFQANDSYWKQKFENGIPKLTLPTDFPDKGERTFGGAMLTGDLDQDIVLQLETIARNANATLYSVLLSVVDVVLGRWSSSDEVVVGSPIAGRIKPELMDQVGYFMNVVPLHVKIDESWSATELAKVVTDDFLGAVDHQLHSFDDLDNSEKVAGQAAFNVLFNLINTDLSATAGVGLEAQDQGIKTEPIQLAPQNSKFDLTLNFQQTPSGLQLYWLYSTDLYREDSIKLLMTRFMNMAELIAESPTVPLKELNDLPVVEEEIDKLDFSFNIDLT
jgi:amino acid adenylation domain-containing protein